MHPICLSSPYPSGWQRRLLAPAMHRQHARPHGHTRRRTFAAAAAIVGGKRPPGPKGLPWIGPLGQYLRSEKQFFRQVRGSCSGHHIVGLGSYMLGTSVINAIIVMTVLFMS